MSQAEITIREACPEDGNAIASVLRELGWFAHINNEPAARTRAHVVERIEQSRREKTHTVLVAERVDGNVVGYLDAHWFPNLLHGNEGYISELFIHPAETGRGIGGQLLAAIKECAIKRGCVRLMLINMRMRESYQRDFYAKHGWKEQKDAAYFTLMLRAK